MGAQILALLELDENSHQVVECLKQSGHNVVACKNFTRAIGVLREKHIDLIVSDVHLENGGNVFDFLKWVKSNPSTRFTQFVMFSCRPTEMAKYIEDGVRTTARLLGAAMYITMDDFDSDKFRQQIDSLLPAKDQSATEIGKTEKLTKGNGD